jgi:DNA-directed RNA polymerase specialized sigma24 family protein
MQRFVVEQSVRNNLAPAEIAELLGKPVETVYGAYSRAMKKIDALPLRDKSQQIDTGFKLLPKTLNRIQK